MLGPHPPAGIEVYLQIQYPKQRVVLCTAPCSDSPPPVLYNDIDPLTGALRPKNGAAVCAEFSGGGRDMTCRLLGPLRLSFGDSLPIALRRYARLALVVTNSSFDGDTKPLRRLWLSRRLRSPSLDLQIIYLCRSSRLGSCHHCQRTSNSTTCTDKDWGL